MNDILTELGDYAKHQQEAADAARKQARYLADQAQEMFTKADEADERAATALRDAAAVRDARRPAARLAVDSAGQVS